MRLAELTITNFRSIKSTMTLSIPSRHLALVGSNNAGKSNIVSALDWVLGSRPPYQLHAVPDDFFDPSAAIVITATVGDITAADKSHLMAIATSKQQRGALSGKPDPEIRFTITIPPLEAREAESEDEEDHEEGASALTTNVRR